MKLNVLIVDDSKTVRKIMRAILEELGHNVIDEASNGNGAIELFFKHSPDLITMDIEMPGMSGIDAIAKIKKINKKIKVIMITAHGQKDIVTSSIGKGANDYILKPITKEKLEASIKKLFP